MSARRFLRVAGQMLHCARRSGQRRLTGGGVGAGVVIGGGGGGGGGGAGASAVCMESAHKSGWSSTGLKLTTMLGAWAATWQANGREHQQCLYAQRTCMSLGHQSFQAAIDWHREGDG